MLHKAWNSKGEVPYCFLRSSIKFQGHTGQNITDFDPNWAFPDYRPVAAFKSLRFALFSKVRVGAKEGGSHYWEMAVAITCGYGGYLLPLLAAHSSLSVKSPEVQLNSCARLSPVPLMQWDTVASPLANGNAFLTHWDRDQMADIFQTTFSNAFSWMKIFEFQLIFHGSLFLRVQQYSSIGSNNGMAPNKW